MSRGPTGPSESPSPEPTLARTIGLTALIIYGVGDMLGSGIYALIGRAAGVMGNAIWLAFLTSMLAALLTGLSYASLGSRYPRAAGAAYVTQRAFRLPFLSYLIGLAVLASGLTSFATQSRAFSGYFLDMAGIAAPMWMIVLLFIAALTFINFWGMRESIWLNFVCTAIEVGGLFLIIFVGVRFLGTVSYFETPTVAGEPVPLGLPLMLQGAVLTFYSFIGFEDMINVVEEVKNPRRNFPRAVLFALAIATVIYILVSLVAISVVPHAELAASDAPLVEVVRRAAPWFPPFLFSLIALFAITNTALLNYIMGSRLAYGMARQGLVPARLGAIHPVRRTPYIAILILMVIVGVLALSGNIANLARATSVLLLFSFILVNASLIVLQRRPNEPRGALEIPAFVPAGGILICAAMLLSPLLGIGLGQREELLRNQIDAFRIAAFMLAGIVVLYFLARPRNITEETLADLSDDMGEEMSEEMKE